MANLATSLLDFILDLLGDPETAADFQADPQATLAAAGLADVCPADVQNVRMVLEDSAPLGVGPTGLAHVAPVGAVAPATVTAVAPVAATTTQVSPATAPAEADSDSGPDAGSVVEQLRYIQQTFTFDASTNIDARDSVWAGKDVYQLFGDDSVMAAGGSVAAGGDVEDVTVDHSIEDAYNIDGSFNPANSGNTVEGDGNAVGRGNDVENTDNSIEVDDSTGTTIGDDNDSGDAVSGVGNVVGNDVDLDVDTTTTTTTSTNTVEDSYDDESVEVDLDGSFNETDSSTNTDLDLDVELDDVTVGNDNIGGAASLDASTTVEDSGNTEVSDFLNGNVVAVDDAIAAADNEVDA
ncbi:MAG: uncharacterized protein JWR62_2039 [Modestobacter sp.]|jgi:hypothetical protein|nr:uncharacterized protein [Modestobacter sp.]